jgi:hypothetical protein
MDRIAQQRRIAHLHAARNHEQNSEFHRGVEQFFASIGDDAAVWSARRAAEREQQYAERERHHLQRLEHSTVGWSAR